MPAASGDAIEVDDLTVRFGDLTAVDGLSFTVPTGSITALLGPNGAGKTTTVETLEGYRRPDSGIVRVLGLDPAADQAALSRQVGVMLQEGGVHTGIRPAEALGLYAAFYDDPEPPEALLERVRLADRRTTPWRRLSGGERQRLSLALALVGRPRLVFLDEPTAGIDPEGRQLVRAVIRELAESGVTVLLTTHDLDEAERLATRVVIVDRGRALADGTPDELMRGGPGDEIRFSAAPGLDIGDLGAVLDAVVREDAPGEYHVAVAPDPATIATLTRWLADHEVALADLRAGRQRLEDVFLRITSEASVASAAHDPEARRARRASR